MIYPCPKCGIQFETTDKGALFDFKGVKYCEECFMELLKMV